MPIWTGVAKFLIRAGVAQRLPAIRALMGDGVPFLRYYSRRILASPNVEWRATQALLESAEGDLVDLSLGAPAASIGLMPPCPSLAVAPAGYPPVAGLKPLRQAIARKLSSENGLECDPDREILVCNGVSQAIGLMLDTFVDERDRVVVFDPSFFAYRAAAQNRGAWVKRVDTWMESGRTRFQERSLRRALRGAKLLILNTPNNPTGGVFDPESLERIAWWCARHDVLIFSDEVYERFQYEGEHESIARFSTARERTITANSFSKSFGLAAMRVGYVAGSRHLLQPMLVSALSTAPFVSTQAQHWAISALGQPRDRFAPMLTEFRERRDLVARSLGEAGLAAEPPAGAFYFWVPIRQAGLGAGEFATRLLADENVLVMPGDSCGRAGGDFIRISFAGDRDRLEQGLRRLRRFLASHVPNLLPLPPVTSPARSVATDERRQRPLSA